MGGFIKGIVVGVISFVLGFAVLSVVIPVAPEAPQAPEAPEAPQVSTPDPVDATQDRQAGSDTAAADGDPGVEPTASPDAASGPDGAVDSALAPAPDVSGQPAPVSDGADGEAGGHADGEAGGPAADARVEDQPPPEPQPGQADGPVVTAPSADAPVAPVAAGDGMPEAVPTPDAPDSPAGDASAPIPAPDPGTQVGGDDADATQGDGSAPAAPPAPPAAPPADDSAGPRADATDGAAPDSLPAADADPSPQTAVVATPDLAEDAAGPDDPQSDGQGDGSADPQADPRAAPQVEVTTGARDAEPLVAPQVAPQDPAPGPAAANPAPAQTAPAAAAPLAAPPGRSEADGAPVAPQDAAAEADPAPATGSGEDPAPTPAAPQQTDQPADQSGPAAPAPQPLPRVQAMPSGTPGVSVRRGTDTEGASSEPADPSPRARTVAGVTVGRLPRIGATGDTAAAPTGAASAPDAAPDASGTAGPAAADPDQPAYRRFAAVLDVPPDSRRMGVVLTDAPGAEAALLELPFAVTVAMDPYDPDGPRRAAEYRRAGHEVALLAAGVPPLATASDIAVTLRVWTQAYPEIIGLMDVPVNGIGSRRALAQDMAGMLVPEGFAVIALRGGLDAFLQSAQDAGLAAAPVFRALDDGGQNLATIRRLIDRAAFEALRSDGIIVSGSADSPETIAALTGFAGGLGRDGVTLVPASAVLETE